jgi:isopenicillin-N N-acyltransferase-like protein
MNTDNGPMHTTARFSSVFIRVHLWFLSLVALALPLAAGPILRAQDGQAPQPDGAKPAAAPVPGEIFSKTLTTLFAVVEPPPGAPARTLSARLTVTKADGLPKGILGQTANVAYQAPDRLRVEAEIEGIRFVIGSDGPRLWIHAPANRFLLAGSPDVPRFAAAPDTKDGTRLPPFAFPLSRAQVATWPLLVKADALPDETIGGAVCRGLALSSLQKDPASPLRFEGRARLWVRDADRLPVRLAFADGKGFDAQVDLERVAIEEPWPAERWKPAPAPGDTVETVALGHLTRFLDAVFTQLTAPTVPTLGPATGERRVVATEGKGRLELHDGTRVLFLEGTPEEMGRQHGVLLRREVRDALGRILYGIGVGSSFPKGRWFFGEIEEAQRRVRPFVPARHLRECDALADAAGLDREEVRLANVFPELFHCSGFALLGEATAGGRLYHGRVLDYLRGVGLEQNAVVIVNRPDEGHAWVNVSYAGFIGSVTAMNAKRIAIGEMGGRGEGRWDGKPMAQLVREVMEKASTLDEAVEILRKGPRTCEYYYVISDGNTKRATGIAATPARFETAGPGEPHPQLPRVVKDAVLLSAGDRYEELVRRVKAGYGRFDDAAARELMTRPVCMTSNIHSVLFAPETLEFWVANADGTNPAAHCRYTRYNLGEMLKTPAPAASPDGR